MLDTSLQEIQFAESTNGSNLKFFLTLAGTSSNLSRASFYKLKAKASTDFITFLNLSPLGHPTSNSNFRITHHLLKPKNAMILNMLVGYRFVTGVGREIRHSRG